MIFSKVNKLLNKYAICPQCGSDHIRKTDKIRIGDKTFHRSCGCGFSITVDAEGNKGGLNGLLWGKKKIRKENG